MSPSHNQNGRRHTVRVRKKRTETFVFTLSASGDSPRTSVDCAESNDGVDSLAPSNQQTATDIEGHEREKLMENDIARVSEPDNATDGTAQASPSPETAATVGDTAVQNAPDGQAPADGQPDCRTRILELLNLSLIHISEPTRP